VDRRVEIDYVFDRLGESHLVQAYRILVPERQKRTEGVHDDEHGRDLCASLLDFTEAGGNDCESDVGVERVRQVPGAGRARRLVFEDEGFSGSTLVQPALERLRDLVAQVHVDILLCHAPDRLARRYAYQVLLLEEFARAGTAVRFLKATPADTPEAALLVQVQGIIAEYEKAQILERTRRGKLHRAKAGSVNVLSGAPFGYRYVRKGTDTPAHYEIVEHEARIVRELFRHYTEEPLSLRALGKWLTEQGIPTAAGKTLWDHSTVRQLLRNPAYCGQAAFGRTAQMDQLPRTTRWHRLSGAKPGKRPARRMTLPEHWIHIVVPAIVSEELFELAARRLEDNRRFSARRTKQPSLLQGLIACRRCSHAFFRAPKKSRDGGSYVYYRCAGNNYKRRHGRVCQNRPVRQDHLDALVWEHIVQLMSEPTLIRRELDRRLEEHRKSPAATMERSRLQQELKRTESVIKRLVTAYEEDLVSLDELRQRMPELRRRQKTVSREIESLDSRLANEEIYLKLAENLESFLARLRDTSAHSSVLQRQQVVRLVIREVLVDTDAVVIRHTIPGLDSSGKPSCHLWGRSHDTYPAKQRGHSKTSTANTRRINSDHE
jgi:site-specific DNA recombinase